MKRLLVFFTLCVLILSMAGGAAAQDTSPEIPFIEMLGAVPREVAEVNGLISYADAKALVEARPGGFWPQNMLEFESAQASEDPRFGVLMAAMFGLNAGMGRLGEVFRIEGMREAVGFDFFTVHRTLEFGEPPAQGNVLQGDFDVDAVNTALTERGFTQDSLDGAILWCGPDGCDQGLRQNLIERDPADPFGGMLGRKQPLAFVPPDTLLSSASNEVVESMLASFQSPGDSILDVPEYRAAAEAITARGTLLQAVLVPPAMAGEQPVQEGSAGVPRYELAAIAHVRDTKDVLTLVALVYPNEQLADQAGDMLVPTFNAAQSLRVNRLFSEMIAERGGTIARGQTFVSPTNDYAVALLEIRSPVESPEPDPDAQPLAARTSGLVFRLLIQSLYARDTPWLAPVGS